LALESSTDDAGSDSDTGSPVGALAVGFALGAAIFGGAWWLLRRYGYIA
jgi:hypothetical protein